MKAPKVVNSRPISETSSISGETLQLSKTIMIFDFDDTLICTKYLDSLNLNYHLIFSFQSSLEDSHPSLMKELNELENTILDLFNELADKNYEIIIVSNADLKWISNCLTHFLPDLGEYIQQTKIKIYSAKNMYSGVSCNSEEWKRRCFSTIINENYLDENNSELNIISIGDGADERNALTKVKFDNSIKSSYDGEIDGINFGCVLKKKFIQFIDSPSITSIIRQLDYIQNNIDDIMEKNSVLFKMKLIIENQNIRVICESSKDDDIKYVNKKKNKIKNKHINKTLKNDKGNFSGLINNKYRTNDEYLGINSFLGHKRLKLI